MTVRPLYVVLTHLQRRGVSGTRRFVSGAVDERPSELVFSAGLQASDLMRALIGELDEGSAHSALFSEADGGAAVVHPEAELHGGDGVRTWTRDQESQNISWRNTCEL